ncbi:MAG: DUF2267 domain-containing protein [Thermoleophilaceae bacterium]
MAASRPDLISIIEREGRLTHEQAERALHATLKTLGERLSGGEARDLAEELPDPFRPDLFDGDLAQGFGIDEFLRRIAEREGVSEEDARRHARAVFAALGFVVSPEELHDMTAELPKEFAPVVAPALLRHAPPPPEPPVPTHTWSAEKVVDRVARLAEVDEETAARAIEAVLETLAERISGGQARDLEGWLPRELRPPVERARQAKGEQPLLLSLDEFLQRVAEREGVSPDEARRHAHAVFATLREAIAEKEFADTLAQLPRDYVHALVRP